MAGKSKKRDKGWQEVAGKMPRGVMIFGLG